jgi:hypothetical protein
MQMIAAVAAVSVHSSHPTCNSSSFSHHLNASVTAVHGAQQQQAAATLTATSAHQTSTPGKRVRFLDDNHLTFEIDRPNE